VSLTIAAIKVTAAPPKRTVANGRLVHPGGLSGPQQDKAVSEWCECNDYAALMGAFPM